jgi:hypothetical protein
MGEFVTTTVLSKVLAKAKLPLVMATAAWLIRHKSPKPMRPATGNLKLAIRNKCQVEDVRLTTPSFS